MPAGVASSPQENPADLHRLTTDCQTQRRGAVEDHLRDASGGGSSARETLLLAAAFDVGADYLLVLRRVQVLRLIGETALGHN